MPQTNINLQEFIGWFWTAIGAAATGFVSVAIYLWKLASKFTEFDKDIAQLKEIRRDDMQKLEKELNEIKHSQESKAKLIHEILQKLSETKDFLADENRKNNNEIREYFSKKYAILDERIYDLRNK